ncbi:hypothetical protein R1flu_020841 [Riccia fluitans]|uniref:Hemimethylated DNA-binding domain-containing protein n=1 Tax=Riccia fluitans TaxID=41844 RepID=A0ABD1ZMV1_9MARC
MYCRVYMRIMGWERYGRIRIVRVDTRRGGSREPRGYFARHGLESSLVESVFFSSMAATATAGMGVAASPPAVALLLPRASRSDGPCCSYSRKSSSEEVSFCGRAWGRRRTSEGRRNYSAGEFLVLAISVNSPRSRKVRLVAAAARQGDGEAERERSSSTKRRTASAERSESANEELLLFLFQLDLSTRLQRALNNEQYEAAQQLREKIAEVEQEVARQREAKMGSVSSKDEAQDTALTVLRLKADLRRAIEGEDYTGAARIRDQISKLEAESLAASARALAYQNLTYKFRLGQRVKHTVYGYQGIICGMDPRCCESEEWADAAGAKQLARGQNQPFYQILVDVHEEPSLLVAYVAEDCLSLPEREEIGRFDHPYTYFLFYGMDSVGDFIPSKQLRDKYNAPRHEVPYDENSDSSSGSDDAP